ARVAVFAGWIESLVQIREPPLAEMWHHDELHEHEIDRRDERDERAGARAPAEENHEHAEHCPADRDVLAAAEREGEQHAEQPVAAAIERVDREQREAGGDGLEVKIVEIGAMEWRIEQIHEREQGACSAADATRGEPIDWYRGG